MTLKDAKHIADRLIRSCIARDHMVPDMLALSDALVRVLQAAYEKGWNDHAQAQPFVTKHWGGGSLGNCNE
jgi:hypothetical protein